MPKIKVLSGLEVVKFLERHGFIVVSQRGSHIKMVIIKDEKDTIIIPRHKSLKRGLLHGIIKKCMQYVDHNRVKEFFYTH